MRYDTERYHKLGNWDSSYVSSAVPTSTAGSKTAIKMATFSYWTCYANAVTRTLCDCCFTYTWYYYIV